MKTLKQIAKDHPALTFQNVGYEYINKKQLSKADIDAITEIETILKGKIDGFSRFNNFRIRKDGGMDVRLQYYWDHSFCGVGYFPIDEIDAEETEG